MGSQPPQAVSVPMGGKGLVSFGSLARQSSIYSLTLDEFQNSIPDMKNFGSMNMDEFLKNIWTAEEQQAMQAVMVNPTSEGQGPTGEGLASQPSLQGQGSLTLPGMLSRKTVDEVWRDIHGDEAADKAGAGEQQRTATFGEMTLEDFLVRAGVVREDLETVGAAFGSASAGFAGGAGNGGRVADAGAGLGDREGGAGERDVGGVHPGLTLLPANAADAMQLDAFKQQQQWLNNQFRNAQQQQAHALAVQQQAEAAAYVNAAKRMGNGVALAAGLGPLADGLGNGYGGGLGIGLGAAAGISNLALGPGSPTGTISDGMVAGGGNGLALSPVGGGYGYDQLRSRKRASDGPVEKVVERRQRRMIKNRESAARSRARKQAYTVELEAEVTQLKEENMRLRKLQEEEVKKKQMIEAMIAHAQQSTPKSRAVTLRRTQSAHVSIAIS